MDLTIGVWKECLENAAQEGSWVNLPKTMTRRRCSLVAEGPGSRHVSTSFCHNLLSGIWGYFSHVP